MLNFQTEICTFKTADHERLHGALLTEITAGAGINGTCILIDGANHFYNRHISKIVEVIDRWLGRFTD